VLIQHGHLPHHQVLAVRMQAVAVEEVRVQAQVVAVEQGLVKVQTNRTVNQGLVIQDLVEQEQTLDSLVLEALV
jgi:hypothetical protein